MLNINLLRSGMVLISKVDISAPNITWLKSSPWKYFGLWDEIGLGISKGAEFEIVDVDTRAGKERVKLLVPGSGSYPSGTSQYIQIADDELWHNFEVKK